MNTQLSLMSLFEVGAHRGNKKAKLNPRLKSRIYGFSNGQCLIDLVQTNQAIEEAAQLMFKLGQKKKQILIVGTAKHIKPLIQEFSERFQPDKMPYVNNRWLGGTLTNWSTVKKTLKELEKLVNIRGNSEFFEKISRNQQLEITREIDKKTRFVGGLQNLKSSRPGAVFVLDGSTDPVAMCEADCMNVPVISLVGTNVVTLPKDRTTTVLCNINSINAVTLVTEYLIDSYNRGFVEGMPVTIQPNVVQKQTA
jgi:small subunit ribosomal protein S2